MRPLTNKVNATDRLGNSHHHVREQEEDGIHHLRHAARECPSRESLSRGHHPPNAEVGRDDGHDNIRCDCTSNYARNFHRPTGTLIPAGVERSGMVEQHGAYNLRELLSAPDQGSKDSYRESSKMQVKT